MKRLFTFFTVMCLCAVSMVGQVLYSVDFKTQEDFEAWTVVDVNADDATWKYDEWGDPSYVFYSYSSSNAADDWMISPAITSAQQGIVAVSFTVKGSSYVEKLQLFKGSSSSVDAMTQQVSEVLELRDNVTTHLYLIEVEADETFYLGFKACSDADKFRLYLCNVKAQFSTNPVDLQVTEFLSPESGFNLGQETVTIKVKNAGAVDVNSFDVAYSIDDVLVATETINETLAVGAEKEYTFNAKADLSTPRHLSTLKAWTIHTDDVNTPNDTCTTEVLHKAPASVPYFMGFEANEYTEGITLFNLNEDEGNWDLYTDPWWSLAHTGDYCLAYNYDKNNNGDDWAILEPITIEEAGYYVLKFWYSGDDTHPEKLGVYYGNEASPEAMTNKIVEYAPFARSAYEESINIFYIDQPQDLYIGFHAFSDKDENWLCVDDVSLEKVSSESTDLMISGITNPLAYVHQGSRMNVNFAVRSLGITDVMATVRVKIDDNVVSDNEEVIEAQAIKNIELVDILSTLAAGEHVLVVEVEAADDNITTNNTDTVQFRVMGTPSKRWDFEDGKLPSEFVFRSEDEGTVNPDAGDEFNEAGWGIFNIAQHALYGEHVLAGTSWLDGTDKADRWCVLPPFNFGENPFLVWDVSSFNPNFLETYSIMISTNGDDSWYYYTEKEYHSESSDFKTRGLDLSEYANTDSVYIAFRLRSENCEHLILDNIDVYGGELTGINEAAVDQNYTLVVENDAVVVKGVEVQQLALYDMSGREMARVADSRLSVDGLNKGIYIVKIKTPDKVYSNKVIMR